MSAWVLVLRGFDMDDQAILDVEARIKEALPELEPRCTTVRESLYDVLRNPAPLPFLERVVFPAPEHREERAWAGHVRRRMGAQ